MNKVLLWIGILLVVHDILSHVLNLGILERHFGFKGFYFRERRVHHYYLGVLLIALAVLL